MDKRLEWCLTCTGACEKAVKSLPLRLTRLEESMVAIKKHFTEEMTAIKKTLTQEMLEEFERNKEDVNKPKFKNDDDCYLARE